MSVWSGLQFACVTSFKILEAYIVAIYILLSDLWELANKHVVYK